MNHALELRRALPRERDGLSAAAREEIARLTRPRPGRFVGEVALAWATIVGVIAIAVWAQSPWVSAAAIVLVGSRQLLLGFLIHEQTHCLAFKARHGDLLTNLLVAYPLLVITVEGYAQVHLSHHRYPFTERDPDFVRKSGPDWAVPVQPRRLLWLLTTDFLGLNVLRLIRGKRMANGGASFLRPRPAPAWLRPVYLLGLAAVVTVMGGWTIVLVYWVLPLLTVTQVLVRWGALSEHLYNLEHASIAEASPIILPRWWEKILFPNLNFTLHPYHHYFPGLPFAALSRVHEIFRREGLVDERHVFRGNLAYLRFILTAERNERTEGS